MTGPLQLPGDPVSPNQASTKHYVDSGLAVKADVIGGVVPSGQLGSGVANSGALPAWRLQLGRVRDQQQCGLDPERSGRHHGAERQPGHHLCGVLGKIRAASRERSDGGNGCDQVFVGLQLVAVALDQPGYSWSEDGKPGGVRGRSSGSEPQYYVYIAGTGTPEAVLVTGELAMATASPGGSSKLKTA